MKINNKVMFKVYYRQKNPSDTLRHFLYSGKYFSEKIEYQKIQYI